MNLIGIFSANRNLRLFASIASLAWAGSVSMAQPTLEDPNLAVREVVTGLTTPIGLAFIGSTDFLVCEKNTGQVKRVTNGSVAGTVLDLAVNFASERGLLGIALHPNFPIEPSVYLFWSESLTGTDTGVAADIALMGNRIDKFTWNGSVLTFDKNIFRIRAFQADAGQPVRGNHNGGVIRFGPDGKLYAIVGDLGRRGWLQNNFMGPSPDDQFGGPKPDPAHTSGVILRLNADGTTPADNPFVNSNLEAMAPVWMFGVRNGFGLAFDPLTGNLWSQENGDDTFDEMNLVERGMNGGWVQMMGPMHRIGQFRDIEMTLGGGLQQLRWPPSNIATSQQLGIRRLWPLANSAYRDPKFSWKFAVAPAGINFVHSNALGEEYRGDLFVGASRTNLSNGYLMKFEMNGARTGFSFDDNRLMDLVADNSAKFDPVESESLIVGQGFGIVPALENSPAGTIYMVSLDQGRIYEIHRP